MRSLEPLRRPLVSGVLISIYKVTPLRRIKALIAKLGLDTHWRGAIIVAYMLKKSGMDVIYLGNAMPEEIIMTAIDEDVDIVGLSSLGGAHVSLGRDVIDLAKRYGILENMVFVIGGVIPPADVDMLRKIGYDEVFLPGAKEQDIVPKLIELVKIKRKTQ